MIRFLDIRNVHGMDVVVRTVMDNWTRNAAKHGAANYCLKWKGWLGGHQFIFLFLFFLPNFSSVSYYLIMYQIPSTIWYQFHGQSNRFRTSVLPFNKHGLVGKLLCLLEMFGEIW